MNVFVYSDESGVLDPVHNEYFAYGGLIFLGGEQKDAARRRYAAIEEELRARYAKFHNDREVKASKLSNRMQADVIEALTPWHTFGAIVVEKELPDYIFTAKKTKQRYLDFVYQRALKEALKALVDAGELNPNAVENVYVRADDHSSAINEHYELTQALEEDLKYGKAVFEFDRFFPPLFPTMQNVELAMHDSQRDPLIRAADMVANHVLDRARGKVAGPLPKTAHYLRLPE